MVRNIPLGLMVGALFLFGCSSSRDTVTDETTFCEASTSLLDLLEEASDPARLRDSETTTRARVEAEKELMSLALALAPADLRSDVEILVIGLERKHRVLERYGHDRLRLQTEAGFDELEDLLALQTPDALAAVEDLSSGSEKACQILPSGTIDES